jgi:TATA-box binding protein (TBP) (component of TFIID and TFIIIB)
MLARHDVKSESVVVDNISASGDFRQRVNLTHLQQTLNCRNLKERNYFTVHFDRNFFPGAFCKTLGFGTITVFPSGKYVVVGAKCLEHITNIHREMTAVIATL